MARGDQELGRLSGRPVSRSLSPLRRVLPFLRPYRGRIAIGILALVISSATTLALPQIAGGRIHARGLTLHEAQFLMFYYIMFYVAGASDGLATAPLFYFITLV